MDEMKSLQCDFKITGENIQPAYTALNDWYADNNQLNLAYDKCFDIYDLLELCGWVSEREGNGEIYSMAFMGIHEGREAEIFPVIAPFVERGSFLEVIYPEGGTIARWIFTGKSCHFVPAELKWPSVEDLQESDTAAA